MQPRVLRTGKYHTGLLPAQVVPFYKATVLAEGQACNRWYVRLRTNATGAVYLTIRSPLPPVVAGPWKPQPVGVPDARSAYLSNSVNLQKPGSEVRPRRPRQRPERLSTASRRGIREHCAVLDSLQGGNLVFGTLTLPGSTRQALATAAWHTRDLQNAFLRALTYHTQLLDYVWVWELQKRGALHAHFAMGLPPGWTVRRLNRLVKRLWRQVLETYSDKTGVDLFGQADGGTWRHAPWAPKARVEKVKYSVVQYMSKYLSKGNDRETVPEDLRPSSWWSASRPLSVQVNAHRKTVSVEFDSADTAARAYHAMKSDLQERMSREYVMENPYTREPCGMVYYRDRNQTKVDFLEIVGCLYAQADRLNTLNTKREHLRTVWLSHEADRDPKIYLWRE